MNNIVIHKKDALEYVKGFERDEIDMVLIDPPYGELDINYKRALHAEFERICKGQIAIYGTLNKTNKETWLGVEYADSVCPWIKPETTKAPKYQPSNYWEIIMLMRNVELQKELHNTQYSGIFSGRPVSKEHPWKKPIEDIERLIRLYTKPGDIVLDCFAGTGTTGEACDRLDRRYRLCDIETGVEYNDKKR